MKIVLPRNFKKKYNNKNSKVIVVRKITHKDGNNFVTIYILYLSKLLFGVILKRNKLYISFEDMEPAELAKCLEKFYVSARRKDRNSTTKRHSL